MKDLIGRLSESVRSRVTGLACPDCKHEKTDYVVLSTGRAAFQCLNCNRFWGETQYSPTLCREPARRERVNTWFELTYAQYLTIPRSILEAMPDEWQERFVACLNELDATFDWRPDEGRYWVQLKDGQGRYVTDRLMEYRRPDYAHIESIRTRREDDGEQRGTMSLCLDSNVDPSTC